MRNVAVLMPSTVRPFELAVCCEAFGGPAVAAALHAAVGRGSRVVAVGAAVFSLAAAGLLTDRRVAADETYAAQLTTWFPLLEQHPGLGVEEAAGQAGFSSAALLRQHFRRRFGCSPSQCRRTRSRG